jgi:hypothetical protein
MGESDSQPLHGKVFDWLTKQGYFLEMRVAKALADSGFSVSLFESYVDPKSAAVRQIDVAASLTREVAGITVSVALLVECKYCRGKPWVILASPRRSGPFFCFSRVLRGRFEVRQWQRYETLQARVLASMLSSLGTRVSRGARFLPYA